MTEQIRQLEDTLRNNPQDQDAFVTLAQMHEASLDWRALSAVYDLVAQASGEDTQRLYQELAARLKTMVGSLAKQAKEDDEKHDAAKLCVHLGDLYINRLNDHDNAMTMYQQAFKIYNKDTTCLERARSVYQEAQNYERVSVLLGLEQRVHKKEGARDALLANHLEMARVYGDYLNNPITFL